MITNAEFVSRIVNNLRALSKDSHISRRFLLRIGKTKAKFLMSQKLDELSLFREDGIISTIECFRLKKIDSKSCSIFEFNLCDNLMRSVEQLPEGIFGKTGAGIVSVMSVDGGQEYHYISPQRYALLKRRSKYARDTSRYYYVKDGYLYLPNSTTELVEVRMFALDKAEAENACDCDDSKQPSCKSVWESDFVCPDRFLDLVVKDTLQEVASIYRSSQPDENPNMDEYQKSKTTE